MSAVSHQLSATAKVLDHPSFGLSYVGFGNVNKNDSDRNEVIGVYSRVSSDS